MTRARPPRLPALLAATLALACGAGEPVEPPPPAADSVRFLVVFAEADADLPRSAPPPLMRVSAFAGRGLHPEHARAAEANDCLSAVANPCGFLVARNAPVTLLAVESPGLVEGPPAPADTSEAREVVQAAVEFTGFQTRGQVPMACRDFVGTSRGGCVVYAQTDTVVVAVFRRMRRLVVSLAGAGGLEVTVTAPPPLGFDPVPASNPLARTWVLPQAVTPRPTPVLALWLPGAAHVTLRPRPAPGGAAAFRGWQDCPRGGEACELGGGVRAAVTADFEVWDCTAAGLGYAAGPLDPRCVRR